MRGQLVEGCTWKWGGMKVVDIRTIEKQNWWGWERDVDEKKNIWRNNSPKFPNLMKNINWQIEEAYQTWNTKKHEENYTDTSKSNCLTPVTYRKPKKEPEGKKNTLCREKQK